LVWLYLLIVNNFSFLGFLLQNNKKLTKPTDNIVQEDAKIVQTPVKSALLDDFATFFGRLF